MKLSFSEDCGFFLETSEGNLFIEVMNEQELSDALSLETYPSFRGWRGKIVIDGVPHIRFHKPNGEWEWSECRT